MLADEPQPPARAAQAPDTDGAATSTIAPPEPGASATAPARPAKPRMRGRLHAGTFPLALAGGVVLIVLSRSTAAAVACSVYGLTAAMLFGTSAVYHCRTWTPRGEAVLRRMDHANIFLIIAGTYTPLSVQLLSGTPRLLLLCLVWGGALMGVAFRIWWLKAPRWLYTLCYVALGWAAIFYLPDFARAGGTAILVLICVGGLLYTLGATVYALKRPNPWPRSFGFHEVFHAFTIAAFASHYTAILLASA